MATWWSFGKTMNSEIKDGMVYTYADGELVSVERDTSNDQALPLKAKLQ